MIGRRTAISGFATTLAFGGHVAAGTRAALFSATDPPCGQWRQIHEQTETDKVRFTRQRHGGAAFDTRRGRIVLFGSDEHGEDWTNSPLFFDLASLRWSRLYPDDDLSTYHVDRFGLPVAGPEGNHPWAMHTYGTVTYHEADDAIVVSIYPEHMQPGRFTDALAHVWPNVQRHPTWMLDLASGGWKPLTGPAVHFFPHATAYDPERGVVMGYKTEGVFELRRWPIGWAKLTAPGLLGYHNSAVFDSRYHALVVFGSNEGANDIVIYEPATGRHQKMPTPGLRPPRAQARPMAYHAGLGQTALLIDGGTERDGWAETWLYDLGRDAWTRLAGARIPFRLGMNYNMVYAPHDEMLLLVANAVDRPTGVWALRL